jgi:hypothetical protein
MNAVFVTWQDPESRRWYPVGRLTKTADEYQFCYTRGAQQAPNFVPFGRMTNLHAQYRSKELFPLFLNRLLRPSRPEFESFVRWLGFDAETPDPIALLARSGGERVTDTLQLYPCPERTNDNYYETSFFVHGLRHMDKHASTAASTLPAGTKLFPMWDKFNSADPEAIALRTAAPALMIGYVPRYLTRDVTELASISPKSFSITVDRLNEDAPAQFRLLCKFRAEWPHGFSPCSAEAFLPLPEETRH